jgi:hypothetical protein
VVLELAFGLPLVDVVTVLCIGGNAHGSQQKAKRQGTDRESTFGHDFSPLFLDATTLPRNLVAPSNPAQRPNVAL